VQSLPRERMLRLCTLGAQPVPPPLCPPTPPARPRGPALPSRCPPAPRACLPPQAHFAEIVVREMERELVMMLQQREAGRVRTAESHLVRAMDAFHGAPAPHPACRCVPLARVCTSLHALLPPAMACWRPEAACVCCLMARKGCAWHRARARSPWPCTPPGASACAQAPWCMAACGPAPTHPPPRPCTPWRNPQRASCCLTCAPPRGKCSTQTTRSAPPRACRTCWRQADRKTANPSTSGSCLPTPPPEAVDRTTCVLGRGGGGLRACGR
jgi:hypothetical protein